MHIKINKFAEIKSGGNPLPAGVYLATITGAEVKQSKSSDSQMIAVEFTVSEGDFAKRKLFRNFSLSEKALGFLKELCEKGHIEFDDDGLDTENMLGAELSLQVGQREYEGKLNNEVEKIYEVQ